MNFDRASKKMEELMLDLMQRGVSVPQHMRDDMGACRTQIGIASADDSNIEAQMQVVVLLQNTETNLLLLADTAAGGAYADEWQQKIREAYEEPKGPVPKAHYVSGIPKGEPWIRIQPSVLASEEEINSLLLQYSLAHRQQEDGYWLIYGNKEDIRGFLEEVRKRVKPNR
jgi:hypothetical protein